MQPSRRRRRTPSSVAALMLAAALVAAGCSGGDDTTAVSTESEQRSTTTEGSATTDGGDGDATEYCAAVEQLDVGSGGLDLSRDAEGALRGIEAMAEVAPAELDGAFETFLDGIGTLATLDQDDPNALTGILDLVTDPEFTEAADQIERYTKDECGIDLGAWGGFEQDSMGEDPTTGTEGQIELEDVDAVKDQNASASWPDKLNTTVINFGREVDVSSDADALSADEALQACTALLSSLSAIDPEVTVTVSAGEVELARSDGASCVAS